jgi:hypothetical protein
MCHADKYGDGNSDEYCYGNTDRNQHGDGNADSDSVVHTWRAV